MLPVVLAVVGALLSRSRRPAAAAHAHAPMVMPGGPEAGGGGETTRCRRCLGISPSCEGGTGLGFFFERNAGPVPDDSGRSGRKVCGRRFLLLFSPSSFFCLFSSWTACEISGMGDGMAGMALG